MNILVINGSPSGDRGATWWVLRKFVQGMEDAGGKPTVIHLAGKKIHHCTGEFACWFTTPGKCIHRDDMDGLLDMCKGAEATVYATPLYVDGMTGLLKNFIDRGLPLADPHFEIRDGHCRHPGRDAGTRGPVALVSVCGFHEVDNFDPLVAHVEAICKNMNSVFAGAVLRPAAPALPHIPKIHPLYFKISSVKKAIRKAGEEFVKSGRISDETARSASADLMSKERYMEEVNKHFDEVLNKRSL